LEEVVGVVLCGVSGIRIGVEAAIYDVGGCVSVDLAIVHGARRWRLNTDVAYGPVKGWVYKLGVILVHDFLLDEGGIFDLLGKRCVKEVELDTE